MFDTIVRPYGRYDDDIFKGHGGSAHHASAPTPLVFVGELVPRSSSFSVQLVRGTPVTAITYADGHFFVDFATGRVTPLWA